jgi:undecaprenyl-diphosphatase
VLVQVATLIGVFGYFWRDIVAIVAAVLRGLATRRPFGDPLARLGWNIVLATIPAGLIGLTLKDTIESAFNNPLATALFLLGTAVLLIVAERAGDRVYSIEEVGWKDALLIGFFQALAVFPGVSRSGATITGGMVRELKRPPAARFAFLMSIPIMLAAGLLASLDLISTPHLVTMLPVFIPGFITAAVVGYIAIAWLLTYLTRHPLTVFAIYCILASLVTIAYTFLTR